MSIPFFNSLILLLTACKKDTYGDVRGLLYPYSKGLENECKKCPENSITKKGVIAQSVADCECDEGYDGRPAVGIACTRKSVTYNITIMHFSVYKDTLLKMEKLNMKALTANKWKDTSFC